MVLFIGPWVRSIIRDVLGFKLWLKRRKWPDQQINITYVYYRQWYYYRPVKKEFVVIMCNTYIKYYKITIFIIVLQSKNRLLRPKI